MVGKQPKRKTIRSLIWETLYEEWVVWLAVVILLSAAFLFSNQLAVWLEGAAFLKVLDSLSKLGLLIAVIAFLREIPKWEARAEEEANRRRFEYWKTIDAANVARESSHNGRFTSHALKIALESLTRETDKEGRSLKIGPINVSGADLTGINLENAHLYVVGFRDANLSGAIFCKATLDTAYFQRSRLFGANFSGATFHNQIVFSHALYNDETKFPDGFDPVAARAYKIAPNADLQGAVLIEAMLWDAQLEEANLQDANLRGALLGGNLRRAKLQNADLSRAKMGDANFESAILQNANLQDAGFHRANLQNTNLQNADLQDTALEDANLYGADLRGVRNVTIEQIKAAKNWEKAIYDDDFRQKLGLSS
ncbi:MAG: hypothetical protein BroJett011_29470 [Chloroflexota bacterium]|nr:MAG: hypothetical protein BroJett011_29470 [Chloroflexota bacterium]